ncbi:MAG: gluconate 2-dehydrogenase subunit 3 family protein [Myxococcota bacterium]|nr:gluconate 2-dehydrogenase subunit 3 family protein [Myxococcota bacterium]
MRGANDDFPSPFGHAPRTLSRRALLEAGAVGLVLGGAAVATLRARGYTVPATRTLAALAAWQFVVVQHAARRIVAPDRQDADIARADDLDVAGFVDGWVSRLPPRTHRDLGRFLAYVEHVAPLRVRFASRFTRLVASDQDEVLRSLESSSSDLLRAGFDGLRSLVFLGYYRDARTWKGIGYDGPLIGRPRGGW